MSLLVVAAVRFEVEPLLKGLSDKGIKADFAEVGIGSVKAARSYDRLRKHAEGKDVIYVGTCGTFGKFAKPILVRASRAVWLPPCYRASIAWAIEGVDKPFDLPEPPKWALDLKPVTVICSPTIAKSSEISDESANSQNLGDLDNLVENLELYSCGEALASSAKSFVSIFGVTNAVGPDGRKQWKENFKGLASMTAEYVCERISQ